MQLCVCGTDLLYLQPQAYIWHVCCIYDDWHIFGTLEALCDWWKWPALRYSKPQAEAKPRADIHFSQACNHSQAAVLNNEIQNYILA